jgi:hypothetical protein
VVDIDRPDLIVGDKTKFLILPSIIGIPVFVIRVCDGEDVSCFVRAPRVITVAQLPIKVLVHIFAIIFAVCKFSMEINSTGPVSFISMGMYL